MNTVKEFYIRIYECGELFALLVLYSSNFVHITTFLYVYLVSRLLADE